MTAKEYADYVRYKTRTNSNTLTDSDLLLLMNTRKNEIAAQLLEVDEDILLVPMTTDLVADQREYPFDADLISRMKRIEAKLDGSDWVYLKEIDLTDIHEPISSEADITDLFSNTQGEAFYDLRRKSLYIYSGTITAVTDGLKAWVNTFPTDITDLSDDTDDLSEDPSATTHGIPKEMHEIWARGVIIDYKESREKPIPLTEREQNYEMDLRRAASTLKRANYDRDVIGSLPDEGWDEGYNL